MGITSWLRVVATACFVAMVGVAGNSYGDVPKELYDALGVSKNTSPKILFDALDKRYRDPKQGAGKGKYAGLWQPTPMSKYFDPLTFYKPPSTVKVIIDNREQCVGCHSAATPGWVMAWKKSVHANLDQIRKLSPDDPRFYKKAKLKEVEKNLRSMGQLGRNEQLKEVSCIDCHVGINVKNADHAKDLRLPDVSVCGTCHLQEFAERESERDTLNWPQNQWPKGRPSHALDYRANVETGIWAAMPQREIADGCTACHHNQNKCDTCHTRHEFSVIEARKPEACATCHRGIDHNNYESYITSKHGSVYTTLGDKWNWEVPLKDAFTKGGQTSPTCQTCHMEYKGEYGHNMVRKVRWGNYPAVPGVAENILKGKWFKSRKEAWVKTCTECHSKRFAWSYLGMIDKATLDGLAKYKEAHEVVVKLHEDGLLPGQKTNRPAPPAPEKDGPVQFFQLFWTKANNPTAVEFEAMEMGENDLVKLHVGIAHVNPGNWTYTEGWEPMNRAYAKIMQANTELREMASLKTRIAKLETRFSWLGLNSDQKKASLGGLGGGLLFAGGLTLWGWRRSTARGKGDGEKSQD